MPEVDVRVVGISGLELDYPQLIAEALRQQGFRCETYAIPFSRGFTPSVVQELKAKLRKTHPGTITIYCSGSAEVYLAGPHISVHFSAYRPWFRPQRMRVIAHPWTHAEPACIPELIWTDKPPLTVGFMGTAYSASRVGRIVGKSILKRSILNGNHLRLPGVLTTLHVAGLSFRHAMTFPRAETLTTMKAYAAATGMDLRIVDTGGFAGSQEEIAQYQRSMHDLTYVLCPRGIENYSFRFYEALKFGRVPVLVDTEMVLPDGVNWDELMVRVPYSELRDIGAYIRRDYERNSGAQFKARQQRALQVMADLCGGGWARGLAHDVRLQVEADAAGQRR